MSSGADHDSPCSLINSRSRFDGVPTHLLGDELTLLEERVSENQPERVVLWACGNGIEAFGEGGRCRRLPFRLGVAHRLLWLERIEISAGAS